MMPDKVMREIEIGGLGGNRTPVQGFAVLCVATPPRGRPAHAAVNIGHAL
jgi:hypothetical protein